MNPLFRVISFGQSPWLDNIRRGLITSGGLQRLITRRLPLEDFARAVERSPGHIKSIVELAIERAS